MIKFTQKEMLKKEVRNLFFLNHLQCTFEIITKFGITISLDLPQPVRNCPFTPFIDKPMISPHKYIKKFYGNMFSAFLEQKQKQNIKSTNSEKQSAMG